MTKSDYTAQITEIMDGMTGGMEYPDSFESDAEFCWPKRMPPAEAATKLLADYGNPNAAE